MRLGSLRLRLVAGGIIAILLALTIAGAGLILLFERHVTRTMADDLDVHLKQLVAGVDVDQDWQPGHDAAAGRSALRRCIVRTLLAGVG